MRSTREFEIDEKRQETREGGLKYYRGRELLTKKEHSRKN